MSYAEADVERDAEIAGQGMGMDGEPGPRALARLKSAALEGAKVPGLVADNAALVQAVRRYEPHLPTLDSGPVRFGEHAQAAGALRAVLAQAHPGAALLAEHEAQVSALHAQVQHWRDASEEVAKNRADETRAYLSEVSTLQARVAEEEANHKRTMGELDASEEEVTTLRARVEVLTQDARTASDAMDAAQARATEAEKRVTELEDKLKRTAEVIGSSPEELPDAAHALWEDADEQRTRAEAAEARVVELEKRADERREHLLDLEDAKRKAEAERDALRAQVAESERTTAALQVERNRAIDYQKVLRQRFDTARNDALEEAAVRIEVEAQESHTRETAALLDDVAARVRSLKVTALTAPPAETKSMSGDSPVLYVLELYRGEGEWDPMFLGTIASTVREKVDVKDRSMGSTRIAEYVRRPPAETTPAPEREEVEKPKRSCNLHADCDAEPGECCNSSDCPDHQ